MPDFVEGYLLRVDKSTAPAPDFETEPNDDPTFATAFDPSVIMRGRGAAGDRDLFRVTVTGQPQLWEAEARGARIESLAWVRGDGTIPGEGRPAAAGEPATIPDLYLVPGDHLLRVSSAGEYELHLIPIGPPDADAEREPNNDTAFAEPLRLSRERVVGRLPVASDRDVFRFSIAGPERIAITVTPPSDGAIDLSVETRRSIVARGRPVEV